MPSFRILRCANATLYLTAAIMMIGAAAYVLCCKDILWQQIAAVVAAIITPVWAACYAMLRFTVDSEGITRRSIRGTTSLKWKDLTQATLTETHNQGTASCTLLLQTENKSMRISSDILPLDDVQELARELRECGLLH